MGNSTSLEEDKKIVNEILTKKRNQFLAAFLLTLVISTGTVFYNSRTVTPETLEATRSFSNAVGGLTVFLWMYLTFKLSRFLQLPRWKIAVYTILMLLPPFYFVSFASLLREIKIARRWVNEQKEETS